MFWHFRDIYQYSVGFYGSCGHGQVQRSLRGLNSRFIGTRVKADNKLRLQFLHLGLMLGSLLSIV
jgi:hypothetical protein